MRVLVACEESQAVCNAFREKGHEAYSCDLQECSGGHPEWHVQGDCLKILRGGVNIQTMDGKEHWIEKWDLLIAHPPCTYLSNVCTRGFSLRCTPAEKVVRRWDERAKAAIFFMYFVLSPIKHVCVENPVGYMNNNYRKPSQIIEPYQFADSVNSPDYVTKRTCLWLKGLPKLKTNNLPRPDNGVLFGRLSNGKMKNWTDSFSRSAKVRSKTFQGIAEAMADQWGDLEALDE